MPEALERNRARHEQEIERIRSDRDLSTEAKRRRMAAAHEKAVTEHRRLVEEDQRAAAQELLSLERKLLGISYPEGARPHERALIAMSYRDAQDRAEKAQSERDNPQALGDLLERAEASGDAQLAEAIFHTATRRGNRNVADSYLSSRSSLKATWERYAAARREADSVERLISPSIQPSRPPELGR